MAQIENPEFEKEKPPFMWAKQVEELKQQCDVLAKKLKEAVDANHTFAGMMSVMQQFFGKSEISAQDAETFVNEFWKMRKQLSAKFSYKVLRTNSDAETLNELEALLNDGYDIYAVREADSVVLDDLAGHKTPMMHKSNDYILRKRVEE